MEQFEEFINALKENLGSIYSIIEPFLSSDVFTFLQVALGIVFVIMIARIIKGFIGG